MRSARDGDDLRFEITVRRTGETFPFRVHIDGPTGEGTISSVPNGAGKDAGIRSTFKLYDLKGLTSPAGEISHVSFYDLGRAFVDFRLREHRNPDPYTSPPSGSGASANAGPTSRRLPARCRATGDRIRGRRPRL
jgi:hypothetical protein